MSDLVEIDINTLKSLCISKLESLGYDYDECVVITNVLMYGQLRGNSQNLIKFAANYIPTKQSSKGIVFVHETAVSARIDGTQGFGILVMNKAVDCAVQKAKTSGFGIVTTNNTSSTTAALGYYSRSIARQGMVGIVMAQSFELVAPFGCKESVFGTNPIAIGIPLPEGKSVSLDMATSSISLFDIISAKNKGESIAEGKAIDSNGEKTVDPVEALKGAILPFGGVKGSHLGFMVELLAGALAGGAIHNKKESENWGNFVLVFDPSLFGERQEALERFKEACDRLKVAEKLDNVDQVYLPGERGDLMESQYLSKGVIKIERYVLDALETTER